MRQIKTASKEDLLIKRADPQRIGASEVYIVVFYLNKTIKEQCKYDRPFKSLYELYNEKKGVFRPKDISEECKERGRFAEEEVIPSYLKKYFPEMVFEMNQTTIVLNDKYEHLSCTPDCFVKSLGQQDEFYDEDSKTQITSKMGEGLIECKSICEYRYETKQCPMQYKFQLQQQLMLTDLKWGLLVFCIECPLTHENMHSDEFFFKTDTTGYRIEIHAFVRDERYENIICDCVNKFYDDFENNIEPELDIFNDSEVNKGTIALKEKSKRLFEENDQDFMKNINECEDDKLDDMIKRYNNITSYRLDIEKEEKRLEFLIMKQTHKTQTTITKNNTVNWKCDKRNCKAMPERTITSTKLEIKKNR